MKYTDDKNTLILLSLLKAHGIRKVVVSPGTTNIALVGSMQYDSWFEMYSSVDERSAAYIACGLASESGEAVVLSCTGATASRNYLPALTEAYYRKLPILAITGSHGEDSIGHLHPQALDRTQSLKDTVRFSSSVKRKDTEWKVTTEVNKAILELFRHGGGPTHLNLESAAYGKFETELLPKVRAIKRFYSYSDFPEITAKRIVIFIGAHRQFNEDELKLIDDFCRYNNAVVFADHTSGYKGHFKINAALFSAQHHYKNDLSVPDLIIHIGEISGEFYGVSKLKAKEVWRVSEDGEIRDLFKNLYAVFEMPERLFFVNYSHQNKTEHTEYFDKCCRLCNDISNNIPELPFGNLWIAQQVHKKLPDKSNLQLGIFNTLRSWNFYNIAETVTSYCNVGGFGIDGALSTLIGASFASPQKLHFCITGDLGFFYDLNSLGNRHISGNVRIMVINNGTGTEFRNYDHPAAQWQDDADKFMAAGGHFASKSQFLVKHFAEDLGFKYISAVSKMQFLELADSFFDSEHREKPIIFEVFTDSQNESDALKRIRSIIQYEDTRTISEKIKTKVKVLAKKIGK